MNTTIQFFATKEQFKAFRKAFAAAQNDKRAHKTYTIATGKRWDDSQDKAVEYQYRVKHDGWLNSAHYLMYNLIAGRDFYAGFTPKTKDRYIAAGGDPDRGLTGALQYLRGLVDAARALSNSATVKIPSWRQKDKEKYIGEYLKNAQATINAFVEPFGNVITAAELARLQVPNAPTTTPRSTEELAKIEKPITYRKLIGQSVVDQTPTAVAIAADVGMPEVEKKGFFQKLFGG